MIGGPTAIGCIGRCKVCGKAIVLMATYANGFQFWAHFVGQPDHYGVLSPGVLSEAAK
jgi:hypothetical protein